MSAIDGFEKYSEKNRAFITLRETAITFSKSAIEGLGFPRYVCMYLDKKSQRAAFIPCGEDDEDAIPFYKEPKAGKQIIVRVMGKGRIAALKELAGITDCGKGIRFYGTLVQDEDTLIINMHYAGGQDDE